MSLFVPAEPDGAHVDHVGGGGRDGLVVGAPQLAGPAAVQRPTRVQEGQASVQGDLHQAVRDGAERPIRGEPLQGDPAALRASGC